MEEGFQGLRLGVPFARNRFQKLIKSVDSLPILKPDESDAAGRTTFKAGRFKVKSDKVKPHANSPIVVRDLLGS
jgi:hypothetical protein